MHEPIAFVGSLDAREEAAFLAALRAALPEESLVPFRALTPAQREAVRVAVVANPDPAEVARLPRLAWIQSLWAGVERLVRDLGAAGVPIVRLVDPELARTMAEAVLAWTFFLQRDMPAYRRQQEAGIWRPLPYRAPAEMTVGLLGFGLLGAAAAGRLDEAGFRVAAWSRTPRARPGAEAGATLAGPDGLARLLAGSDVVVCLLPMTPATRGLLGAAQFAAMKPGAALMNFGRGPIVATDALLAALESGQLSHAVLDVFDTEPLPPESPLWRHPGVTVLPHVTAPTNPRSAAAIVAENLRGYRRTGRIPAAVDAARGY
ncbi:D-isomer specific 2-hydroxyacid dehydrogenase NAD-binding [Methylobacterium sp. 4-46]|uniref:2-hydroxyacid dehydrogenase n=1 Tax=unclassified Methylobacterium TaxID=2615210 RepID=UPI000152D994|nr:MULTISPECIES: glyoxylate/hydroxypyruvate reductase A [Methylobacterium]ACA17941.1 D-isomer specific 2-hydroxyacid dehydrogenase NAD-binding [Methylobacterium sp. 4-46]WFT77242.1 glyoxylate/hydroxypyruvate reductase A [Methylobacterium nodulans]